MFYRGQKRAVILHQVWDTLILRDAMKGTPVVEYAEKLAESITDAQGKTWAKGTPAAVGERGTGSRRKSSTPASRAETHRS